jgi:hypothetical protein
MGSPATGPWDDYQAPKQSTSASTSASTEAGPWQEYGTKSPTSPPGQEPEGFWSSLASSTGIPQLLKGNPDEKPPTSRWDAFKQTVANVNPVTPFIDMAKNAYQHMGAAGGKIKQGDYSGAASEYAGAVPFVGPTAYKMGKQAEEGNYAGAAGTATGLLGQAALPEMVANAPAIGTAAKGAVKGATEMSGMRYGVPLPASFAGAAGGGWGGRMLGGMVGHPEAGEALGATIGAGAPMIRGAVRELAARRAAIRLPQPSPPGDIPYTPSEPPPSSSPPGSGSANQPPPTSPSPSSPPPSPSGPVKGQGTPTPEAAEHLANRVALAKDAAMQLHSQGITAENLANHLENDEVWDKIEQATDIARKTPLGERRVDLSNPLTRAETVKQLKVLNITDQLNQSFDQP